MATNYKGRRKTRKYSEWHYWEQLPPAIRLRITASVQPWSAGWVLTKYKQLRPNIGEARAIQAMLNNLDYWDQSFVDTKAWIPGGGSERNQPSPCKVCDVKPLISKVNVIY